MENIGCGCARPRTGVVNEKLLRWYIIFLFVFLSGTRIRVLYPSLWCETRRVPRSCSVLVFSRLAIVLTGVGAAAARPRGGPGGGRSEESGGGRGWVGLGFMCPPTSRGGRCGVTGVCVPARGWCGQNARPSGVPFGCGGVGVSPVGGFAGGVLPGWWLALRVCDESWDAVSAPPGSPVGCKELPQGGVWGLEPYPSVVPHSPGPRPRVP